MHATDLRCEHRADVPCVDDPAPRFSWTLESTAPDKRQSAYQLRVDSLWDSGRVESAESVGISYAGPPLPAGARCTWTVRVWDERGAVTEWSDAAAFRTGPAEWSAQWIGWEHVHDPTVPVPGTDPDLDETTR
jgi:alpha-L-rhamnosidase